MSARDLVILAQHLIDDFPEEYRYFSETEFTWNDIRQHNRNPLLELGLGVDGLKTGHTAEAGYGLVARRCRTASACSSWSAASPTRPSAPRRPRRS